MPDDEAKKNKAAVSMAKLRWRGVPEDERREIANKMVKARKRTTKAERVAKAKKAAEARWGKKKPSGR